MEILSLWQHLAPGLVFRVYYFLIFVSAVLGIVFALCASLIRKQQQNLIPFGPAIALTGILYPCIPIANHFTDFLTLHFVRILSDWILIIELAITCNPVTQNPHKLLPHKSRKMIYDGYIGQAITATYFQVTLALF